MPSLVSLRTVSLQPCPSANQPAGCSEAASLSTDIVGAQDHLQAPMGGAEAKEVPGKGLLILHRDPQT